MHIKQFLVMFIPIIMGITTFLFWNFHFLCIIRKTRKKNEASKLKKLYIFRLFSSFIISIFLFHTLIVSSEFNLFNYISLNDKEDGSSEDSEFLFVSPNFKCWTPSHKKIVSIFLVPGVFIWGLLVAVHLLILLVKQQLYRNLAIAKRTRKSQEHLISNNKFNFGAKTYFNSVSGNNTIITRKESSTKAIPSMRKRRKIL